MHHHFGLHVLAFRILVGDDCALSFLLLAIHCYSGRASLPSLSQPACPSGVPRLQGGFEGLLG